MAKLVTFKDYGLHRVPDKLTWSIQAEIDSIKDPSLIMLGYGLCGNGLKDIKSREHTLLIPRTDDCIAILLGSYKKYMQEFDATPGTYYLTKGWLESGSNPLQEYQEILAKYGEKTLPGSGSAMPIMNVLYSWLSQEDLEKYRPKAEVAEYCKRWECATTKFSL
jgi:hypothetical protein